MRAMLLAIASVLTMLAPACSLYRQYEARKPDNIRTKETFLADAGFKKIRIDTAHREQTDGLPQYELRYYDAAMARVYWYYDPTVCECIYVGDDQSYDGYVLAARQQQDISEYVAESEDADAASLYAFNGAMFPPPLFLFGGGLAAGGLVVGVPGVGGGHHHGSSGGFLGGGNHHGGGGHSGGGHGR